MTFAARFPGRCVSCDERIHEGDPIRMTDDGAVHDDCEAAAPEPVREHPVCPVCWLTHARYVTHWREVPDAEA